MIAPRCFDRLRNEPRCHAIGNSTSEPKTKRPHATHTGDTSCTAVLMKKYGVPQMRPRATKAAHTRTVMLPQCFFEFVAPVDGKRARRATPERMRCGLRRA